jgi:hypothetical protein
MDITVDHPAEHVACKAAEALEKEKEKVSGEEAQSAAITQDDTSNNLILDEATRAPRADTVHQDTKSAAAHTKGSFVAAAAKRLFTTETAGSEAENQTRTDLPANDISTLTRLQSSHTSVKPAALHNTEPPGKKVGPKLQRSQAESKIAGDSTKWQMVTDWNSKGRQQKRAQDKSKPPPATEAATANHSVPRASNVRSNDIQRLEEKNSTLEQQNNELAAMMGATNHLL